MLLNETNYSPSQISPTVVENPEMELIFLRSEHVRLKNRFENLLKILQIDHAEVNNDDIRKN